MATTYYLLHTKDSGIGLGPYLGHDADGNWALLANALDAHRFESREEAEQSATQLLDQFGIFEIEIRNSPD